MKKIVWFVLACLLALAPEVLAQSKTSPKAAPKTAATQKHPVTHKSTTPTAEQRSELEFQAAQAKMVDRWLYRVPGGDPIVTESEIRCALGPIISVDQVQYTAFWKGSYDNCSAPGLMPISRRLKRRLFQLTHQMPGKTVRHDPDHDPAFEKIYNRFLEALGSADTVEETFGHGDTRLTIVEENGSKEPGVQSPRPPTPYGFTMHSFVTPAIRMDDGVYDGRALRIAAVSWAEKDGSPLRPCFNLSGMFVELPATPAEVAYQPPKPVWVRDSNPPVADVVIHKMWISKGKQVKPPKHFDLRFDLLGDNGQVVMSDIELRDVSSVRLGRALAVGKKYSLRENLDYSPKHWLPDNSTVGFVVVDRLTDVSVVNRKQETGCKWLGAPCWVWPVVAGGAVGAFCWEHHHNAGLPDTTPNKQAIPLPDRPK